MVSFEHTVAYLLPTKPIKKGVNGGKWTIVKILSADSSTDGNKSTLQPSTGKGGTSVCHHKSIGYSRINGEQKTHTCKWRKNNGGMDANSSDGPRANANVFNGDTKRLRSSIASVIKETKK